jgi:dihydrofolate reductase
MRKVVAAINITLDGFCDHTAGIADDELHQHYTELIRSAGTLLYGRITYHLMQDYWPTVVKNPTGNKALDEFALAIHDVPKIVFSRTLKDTDPTITGWQNVTLAQRDLKEKILELRQQAGKDIFVGSPGLISALTNLSLIDEYQLCVHPVIAGSGLPLFKNLNEKIILKLLKTKTLRTSGQMVLYYEPTKK